MNKNCAVDSLSLFVDNASLDTLARGRPEWQKEKTNAAVVT